MTYTTGTMSITLTPGSLLLSTIDPLITAVTGWSRIENAITVGTKTWTVWKSAAANNSFGSDFYMAMGYVTATGTILHMTVFEGWNTGTKLASNFAPNTTQTPTVTTWANPNAAAALPSTGSTIAYMETPALSTTGAISYGISVTADRIALWTYNTVPSAVNTGYYLGLYDTLLNAAADPFPLCALQFAPGGGTSANGMTSAAVSLNGMTTREPLQTAGAANNFGCGANGTQANTWTLVTSSAETYTGKYLLSRVVLQGRAAGAVRGLLKDMYQGPTQSNNGDLMTWTINGVAHTAVRMGGVSSTAIYADCV